MHLSTLFAAELRSSERQGARKYNKSKYSRLKWTDKLHRHFVEAVDSLGGTEKATPKRILQKMSVWGLKIAQVKSHLQVYRSTKAQSRLEDDFWVSSHSHRKWIDLNEEVSSKTSNRSSSSRAARERDSFISVQDSNTSSKTKEEEDDLSLSLSPP